MIKKCFVVMPFETRFDGIWKTVVKPAVEELGHTCNRGDDFFVVGSALDVIFTAIHKADYIIADLSAHNPNVYYELGYSHALQKKVILITQDINSLPFDLMTQRIISYKDTAAGAVFLKTDLQNFITNI